MKKFTLIIFSISLFLCSILFNISYEKNITLADNKPTQSQFEDSEEAFQEKKDKAHKNLNSMIGYLVTAESTVQNFSYLSSDDKTEIISDLKAKKQYLQDKKNETDNQGVDANGSLDSMRVFTGEVETYWDEVYIKVIFYSGKLMQAKVDYLYTNLNSTIDSLSSEIVIAQNGGKDTSQAQTSLDSAVSNLTTLASKILQMNSEFANIQDKNMAIFHLMRGKQYVRESDSVIQDMITDLENTVYFLEN